MDATHIYIKYIGKFFLSSLHDPHISIYLHIPISALYIGIKAVVLVVGGFV